MTQSRVEHSKIIISLGGATTLGLKDDYIDMWRNEFLYGNAPYEVTAEQFLEMFGVVYTNFFTERAMYIFSDVESPSISWWNWFYGLDIKRLKKLALIRLKALVIHACRTEKPMDKNSVLILPLLLKKDKEEYFQFREEEKDYIP